MTAESVARTHRAAACTGKVSFDTFTQAQLVNVRGQKRGMSRSVYHCDFCHRFHLGRRPITGRKPHNKRRIIEE